MQEVSRQLVWFLNREPALMVFDLQLWYLMNGTMLKKAIQNMVINVSMLNFFHIRFVCCNLSGTYYKVNHQHTVSSKLVLDRAFREQLALYPCSASERRCNGCAGERRGMSFSRLRTAFYYMNMSLKLSSHNMRYYFISVSAILSYDILCFAGD